MRATLAGCRLVAAAAAILLMPAGPSAQEAQPPPVFRAGTELIAIDASVVDNRGEPVPGLGAGDFRVSIDGERRAVVSAEFVRQAPPPAAPPERAQPFSSNESAVGGRLVLLVFDRDSIAPGGAGGVTGAAIAFVDQLSPADRIGVLAFPGGVNLNFTADRERVRQTLRQVQGRGAWASSSQYTLGLSEAYEIDRGYGSALNRAVQRECVLEMTQESLELCASILRTEARQMTVEGEQRAAESLRVLRRTLEELRKIDAPKTLIWISEGLPLDTRQSEIGGLSGLAAAARTTVHALHLDQAHLVDVTRRRPTPTLMADRRLALDGLEAITGLSRGAVFSTSGPGGDAFDRIARQMTGYYLLSVETVEADRDGEVHDIDVAVDRRDVRVRARRTFALPPAQEGAPDVATRVADLLRSPLIAAELPLKVATHSLREPGDPRVRVIVSSEIGHDAREPVQAAVGYLVTSAEGEVVATAYQDRLLSPRQGGDGGPLEAVGVVAVPPGQYTLRLAVIEQAGRAGSVEHAFEAGLRSAGPLEMADLLLFPAASEEPGLLVAATDTRLTPGPYSAYLELYPESGRAPERIGVVLEVAEEAGAPALTSAEAGLERSDERIVARGPLPIDLLPPGEYVARAVITVDGSTARQSRPFRLDAPGGGPSALEQEIAATIEPFAREEVFVPALLAPALARAKALDPGEPNERTVEATDKLLAGRLEVLEDPARFGPPSSLLASFLRGLGLLHKGALEEAAGQFRQAVRLSSEFLPGLFYLGACYAAGGRERQAVGAWQTSLIGDDTTPEVFQLLADGFLRLGDREGAISTLEEASAKWPDDPEFARRAAQARAATATPREAVASLLAWLTREPDDAAIAELALRLAMADLAGAGIGDPQAAARLRELVALRRRAGLEPSPLATRWLAYLDGRSASP